MTGLTDGEEHEYRVSYTDGKASCITFPDHEEIIHAYGNDEHKTLVAWKKADGTEFCTETTSYEAATGKVLEETDTKGLKTSYTYVEGNPLLQEKVTQDIGYETLSEDGKVSILSGQKWTKYTYTPEENVKSTVESDGRTSEKTYDSSDPDQVVREVEKSSGELVSDTVYTYDANGNETSETEAVSGSRTESSYDEDGNLTEEIGKQQISGSDAYSTVSTSESSYDEDGNEVESFTESGDLSASKTCTYDGMGRLLTMTDQKGRTVRKKYDCLGREVESETTINGQTLTERSSYDGNGSLISRTDARGVTTTFRYDSRNRKIQETNSETGTKRTSYGYADNLNVKDGLTTHAIDHTSTVTEKDVNGAVTEVIYTDPAGEVVRTVQGDTVTDQTWDDAGNELVTCIWTEGSDEKHITLNLTDLTGQSIARIINPQLAAGAYKVGSESVITKSVYDKKGQVVENIDANEVRTSYTYNGLNQLVKKQVDGVTSIYTYDLRGNQIKEDTNAGQDITNNTYAVTGELLKVQKTASGQTATLQENAYDQEGTRISRRENGITRDFYYDRGTVLYTTDAGQVSSVNVTGIEGDVIGTVRSGGTYYTYHKDLQGSTSAITGQDGSTAALYRYTDFGETETIGTPAIDNDLCYTGAVYDEITGLYYLNARYYDPENGSFLSQDSYRGEATDDVQWNLYTYCANDPVNYVDPSGHSPEYSAVALKDGFFAVQAAQAVVGLVIAIGPAGWITIGAIVGVVIIGTIVLKKVKAENGTVFKRKKDAQKAYYSHRTLKNGKKSKQKHELGLARNKRDQGGEKKKQKSAWQYRGNKKKNKNKKKRGR